MWLGIKFMGNLIDLTGRRFGRLIVIERAPHKTGKKPFWLCRCDCGNEKVIMGRSLIAGVSKSCGCYQRKLLSERSLIHGHAVHGNISSEYKSWRSMLERCYNPKHENYHNYGGRGIKVCDRWLNSFENFYADMGEKPSKKHTIDRFPNHNGDYESENCRWATPKEQANNKKNNVPIEINGVIKNVCEWIKVLGLSSTTVYERIKRGIPHKEALLMPVKGSKRAINMYNMRGVFIKKYNSMTKALEDGTATDVSSLSKCCRGKNEYHNNYKWQYAE